MSVMKQSSFLPTVITLGEARRPLRPVRGGRKRVALQNVKETGLYIIITLHSASNVPARKRRMVDGATESTSAPELDLLAGS
ncbi:unnamed protein product [Protopolystoma xenopodis]|uniref:Uncharacterized protein n=1 Tax=Protopolystoma xenopodis TaxID=117903 RepID=A0A3S4ZEW5_9PLAT|nr:unnamed protein product [Protopolystoma xenopodis]